MGLYKIEQKITTIINNAVLTDTNQTSFTCEDVVFIHGDFNIRDGWLSDYWYATSEIKAENFKEAYKIFSDKLKRIVPRIALIGQCYISFINEPFLITRTDKHTDVGFLRFIINTEHVGLMFLDGHKKSLDKLMLNESIPDIFYFYWNDAVNTTGYASKLILMFSAIETLIKDSDKKKDWELVDKILGNELREDLFGTKEDSKKGLRHRLVHGEYFNQEDFKKNYLDLIHKKIITYFNEEILRENLIDENVINPQRGFFDNKLEGGPYFIKIKIINNNFNLKNIIRINEEKGHEDINFTDFEILYGDESRKLNQEF